MTRPGPAGSWPGPQAAARPGPSDVPAPGAAATTPHQTRSTAPTQALPTAAATPPRQPAASGVPPRPTPLPPPKDASSASTAPATSAQVAGSLAATTVVPDKPPRRPPPRPGNRPARGRRAKLALKRLDPWSVFVTSLMLSLLLAIVTIVASVLLYAVLSALGVPDSINTNVGDITKKGDVITRGKFVGIAALIAGANVLFLTALATIGSMLYNIVATFTGGLEVTLTDRD